MSDQTRNTFTIPTQHAIISWRAILAGLFTTVALAWLLTALGSAIGFSIADGTDGEALGSGLAVGALVWLLATGLIAFFVGGLVTARASGRAQSQAGMLHGLAMWSTAVVVMLVISAWGWASLMNLGASVVGNSAQAAGQAAGAVASVVNSEAMPNDLQRAGLEDIYNSVAADWKRDAAAAIAADEDSDISEAKARQAIQQIDPETLRTAATQLVMGKPEAAKDTLALGTSLTETQIENLVAGVRGDLQKQVDEVQQQADAAMETATTYAQGVMWATFITALLGLVVSMIGGMLGASSCQRARTVIVTTVDAETRSAA